MNNQQQVSDQDKALSLLIETAIRAQEKGGVLTLPQAAQVHWAIELFTNPQPVPGNKQDIALDMPDEKSDIEEIVK